MLRLIDSIASALIVGLCAAACSQPGGVGDGGTSSKLPACPWNATAVIEEEHSVFEEFTVRIPLQEVDGISTVVSVSDVTAEDWGSPTFSAFPVTRASLGPYQTRVLELAGGRGTTVGLHLRTLRITSSEPCSGPDELALSINVKPGAYSLSPAVLDFGLVALPRTYTQRVELQNPTNGTVSFDVQSSDPHFQTLGFAGAPAISSGGRGSLEVWFLPTLDAGEFSGDLLISTSGWSTAVPVHGKLGRPHLKRTPILGALPNYVSFGYASGYLDGGGLYPPTVLLRLTNDSLLSPFVDGGIPVVTVRALDAARRTLAVSHSDAGYRTSVSAEWMAGGTFSDAGLFLVPGEESVVALRLDSVTPGIGASASWDFETNAELDPSSFGFYSGSQEVCPDAGVTTEFVVPRDGGEAAGLIQISGAPRCLFYTPNIFAADGGIADYELLEPRDAFELWQDGGTRVRIRALNPDAGPATFTVGVTNWREPLTATVRME